MSDARPRVVVSHDGSKALLLEDAGQQTGRDRDRDAFAITFDAQTLDGRYVGINVWFATKLQNMQDASEFGLPAAVPKPLWALAEAAIGQHLNENELPAETQRRSYLNIECWGPTITSLLEREAATEQQAHQYLTWKCYRAWEFQQQHATFSYADQLRLRVEIPRLLCWAEIDGGTLWDVVGGSADEFTLRVRQELLRAVRSGAVAAPYRARLLDVRGRLDSPQLSAVAAHMGKAMAFASDSDPDRENAAKEAVTAIESLLKTQLPAVRGTLGDAIKELRRTNAMPPPLLKVLEGIWGFTSEAPGVRHGGSTAPATSPGEAQLVVNICAAFIAYLLDERRGS